MTDRRPAEWLTAARQLSAPAVLVCITRAMGSTPRADDAWMVVGTRGFQGTIGGGQLEYRAIEIAREMIADNSAGRRLEPLLLGPDLEQCCGGAVELLFQPVARDADWLRGHGDATHLALSKSDLATAPDPINPTMDSRLRASDGGKPGNDEMFWLPLTRNLDRIIIHGAGHVGLACARALARLPFQVTLIDPRPERRALADNVLADADGLDDRGAYVLVMTHEHQRDFELCAGYLRRNRFAFLGLIGSASKIARFRKRLREAGIGDAALARLTSPIGLPSIPGKEPAVIAASVAAQLLELQAAAALSRSELNVREN